MARYEGPELMCIEPNLPSGMKDSRVSRWNLLPGQLTQNSGMPVPQWYSISTQTTSTTGTKWLVYLIHFCIQATQGPTGSTVGGPWSFTNSRLWLGWRASEEVNHIVNGRLVGRMLKVSLPKKLVRSFVQAQMAIHAGILALAAYRTSEDQKQFLSLDLKKRILAARHWSCRQHCVNHHWQSSTHAALSPDAQSIWNKQMLYNGGKQRRPR